MAEERTFQFANRARSTLAAAVSSSATVLRVQDEDADKFPDLTYEDDIFAAVIWDTSLNNFEVVYCTAVNSNELTIERGKEGTSPRAFKAGAAIVHTLTRGLIDQITAPPPPMEVISGGSAQSDLETGTEVSVTRSVTIASGAENAAVLGVAFLGNITSGEVASVSYEASTSEGVVASGTLAFSQYQTTEIDAAVAPISFGIGSVSAGIDELQLTITFTMVSGTVFNMRAYFHIAVFSNCNQDDADNFNGKVEVESIDSPPSEDITATSGFSTDLLFTVAAIASDIEEDPDLTIESPEDVFTSVSTVGDSSRTAGYAFAFEDADGDFEPGAPSMDSAPGYTIEWSWAELGGYAAVWRIRKA